MEQIGLSADEITQLMASSIDYHEKNEVTKQSVQNKHLFKDLEATSKAFPGGRELITWRVSGDVTTVEQGYAGADVVEYQNPANVRQASTFWRNRHVGIEMTYDELRHNGISVRDQSMGKGTKDQAGAAATRLANIFEEKVWDMKEGRERDRSKLYWRDGTYNALDIPGVTYYVVDAPSTPLVVAGVDQGANTWWRNRAELGIVANLGNASSTVLIDTLQTEYRQLTRYGSAPNKAYAGSDFIEQLEREIRARGSFTESGWAGGGARDVSMSDISYKGTRFVYEPELDEMNLAKRMYWLEIGGKGICLRHMDGERDVDQTPTRQHDRYVLRVAKTSVLAMTCKRRNQMGVYSIA